ncbi:ATPase, T2SS/T4P/T4SS family [Irregularibacter muris]|uniref:ATPase, T2SS/T4P/T4SS family n=1 Tax=Irregularibacter muris TaxID=1796619 RepID=A0AAE3HCV2_9FIRM|nr:type II/IV secretion system protein [Irregularibacter muris]MCR1897970.1 ATPase, T2SS/T4P/T4SS family [Irregularibacter muris]
MVNKKKIGDLLIESGKLTKVQLNRVLDIQRKNGKKLGTILVEERIINEEDVLKTIEIQMGLNRVDFSSVFIDERAVKTIPYILGKRHHVIPIYFKGDHSLVVAMNDPLDLIALDDLQLVTGKSIVPVIASSNEISRLLEKYFNKEDAQKAAKEFSEDSALIREENLEQQVYNEVNNAPVVRLVNSIIEQGVRNNASDIHIEAFEDRVRIRMRVDGVLHEIMKVDKRTHNAIVSRLKIISDLNIAEKRLPQDGAVVVHVDNRDIDLRISVLPTIFGEKIVIRILDQMQFFISKDNLGFTPKELELVEKMIKSPKGIILVTGPTGSGKSSTLYTLLKELNTETDNIVTVEDPVEYKLDGVNQIQVNPKAGLTFVTSLRSILRQDPDIIMIGEIRDVETAEIAIRASITGHLVLSTIHTNDAISTINRLIDMGIPPYLISTSLTGVISQRLVRKVCTKCKTSYLASEMEKEILNIPKEENFTLYKGKGCGVCNYTGYKGRIAIHEVLKIGKDHREMIVGRKSGDYLRDFSIEQGMVTLAQNAIQLVTQGLTTVEEVVKIVFLED